jgi:very-short-patch-repair endonuclease
MRDTQTPRRLKDGLLLALAGVYADVLRRQGRTVTSFVRWSKVTGRAHEFAWLGGVLTRETLLRSGSPVRVTRDSPLFERVQKMHATATLNPYEREVFYGYPYLIGRRDGETIRAPLLTVPVRIEPHGAGFLVHGADDVVHVNALPLKAEGDVELHDQKIGRLIDATPGLPLDTRELGQFIEAVTREFSYVERGGAALDGLLVAPPAEPKGATNSALQLLDQSALFIGPKTSYFLSSDLDRIATAQDEITECALGPLLAGAGAESQVEFERGQLDSAKLFFPFPSNRSQRRAALLLEDPTVRVVRVEGPPGTGKSLTIANLACHLAATGKTVLVSSQKDKALEVVDHKLRELGLAELPMTLLHRDRESKKDLLRRLDLIRKERSRQEVSDDFDRVSSEFSADVDAQSTESSEFSLALEWESALEKAHRAVLESGGLKRLVRRARLWRTRRKMSREARRATDELADLVATRREELEDTAVRVLQLGRALAVSSASREERQGLRELAAVLKRDQTRYKNFSLFDRLKGNPERAKMLLKLLPAWIMTPDDVARLFPCVPGLFDVVIVDEASQADLPSMTPVAFRGQKLVIFGDSKQMQPRRFAFMSQDVVRQSWSQWGMDRLDEERWFHPSDQSLLTLAGVRAEEEALLDEHFRSLPPIIEFSNERWYRSQLRVMTDERHKRFGRPDQPIMQLHRVPGGVISNGFQENEEEAFAVVAFLEELVANPDYAGASVGVMCLFEEQVALVQEMVADRIPEAEWEEHELVVINPDGFQGDERDVIIYSLSYDAQVMPQSAISARMSDQLHVQGMLNVAFTRARDEVHVFHSAPIEAFTFAGSRASALSEWLQHCERVEETPRGHVAGSRLGNVDSQFEADVAAALREHGVRVTHQYPACGFKIDLLVEREAEGTRLAIECDGERYHLDEHGMLRVEDIERQAILERAGWRVLRVPYRRWMSGPDAEVSRILAALDESALDERSSGEADAVSSTSASAPSPAVVRGREWVSPEQNMLITALKEGHSAEEDVFLRARDLLGSQRLTQKLRRTLRVAMSDLARRNLATIEDGEYFLLPAGRSATLNVQERRIAHRRTSYRGRRRW